MAAEGELARAVELATVALHTDTLGARPLELLVLERLVDHPGRALVAQACLSASLARIAEQRVAAVLADESLVGWCLLRVRAGRPVEAGEVGLSANDLVRRAGAAAAILGTR